MTEITSELVSINITANTAFKAIQFRLNHSPYINEIIELVHENDVINKRNAVCK